MMERGRRRKLLGVVVSDRMDKTVVVEVGRTVRHPKYEKTMRLRKKYKAHDEKSEAAMGDLIEITEARPMSKTKCWRVSAIVRKAGALIEIGDELAEEERSEPQPQPAPETAPAAADESVDPKTEDSSDSSRDQT
ncbi:MAG: 30S ribosomal protein S17 [Planctomycetota bacterium]